jgi:glycosyltransferase involved in cell wall biosynthesis
MKLLFVYRFCGLGGVETSILNRLDALGTVGAEGYALFAEYYGSGGRSIADDPRVSTGVDPDCVRTLLRRRFDAIFVIDYPDFVDLLASIGSKSPVFFETHASLPSALPGFYSKLDHPLVTGIVVPSRFNEQLVRLAWPALPKQVTVIPNSLNGDRFRPPEGKCADDLALPDGGPILLWVGRLEEEKNPEEFIAMAKTLFRNGSDTRLLMVGDAFDTAEYATSAARLRAALGEPWTDFLYFRQTVPYNRMPQVYGMTGDSGGCLVSTSLYESVPMTFLEASACLCPVVSSHVGGIPDFVQHGRTGWLYPSGDVNLAAATVLNVLDGQKSGALKAQLESTRSGVLQHHAPEAVATAYCTLVEQALSRSEGDPRTSVTASGAVDMTIPGLVSVIIPVYNRSGMLREAVTSVLAQTYRNIELILVNDGSTDDTAQVCDQFASDYPLIRVLHISHEGRPGLVREAGRIVARGEFIQYLDSDDLIMPDKFEHMVAGLEANPNCDIAYCYTRRYRLGFAPEPVAAALTAQTFETMLPAFLARRYWLTSTPLYRRILCDRGGPWSGLRFWEDIEYDVRLAVHARKLFHCRKWLTDIRDHDLPRHSGSRILDHPEDLSEAVQATALMYQSLKQAGLTYSQREVRWFVDNVRLFYNRCQEFGLTESAMQCSSIVMDATDITDPARVGEYTVRAALTPQAGAIRGQPWEWVVCEVEVTNQSSVAFHDDNEFPTGLGYHFCGPDGAMMKFDDRRLILSAPLEPGESRMVELPVQCPGQEGIFYLELDVFWASSTWLSTLGNNTPFVKLLVAHPAQWWLHVEAGNDVILEVQDQSDSARALIRKAVNSDHSATQLNHSGFALLAGHEYELRFRARADEPRPCNVGVSMAHADWANLGLYEFVEFSERWQQYNFRFVAKASDGKVRVHFDAGGTAVSFEVAAISLVDLSGKTPRTLQPVATLGRLSMDTGVRPLSYWWGTDRGLAVHRYYLDQFLTEWKADIQGRCLEFQDPQYTPKVGEGAVTSLDILHLDHSNPQATLIADLTKPNQLESDWFDCIVCSHVLHCIFNVGEAISELFRILKPGGVLLAAVPHISMYGPEYREMWRFTPQCLAALLAPKFGQDRLQIRAYGNSLTAAGEIRGVVSSEFLPWELDHHDPRFPVEVCARAQKPKAWNVESNNASTSGRCDPLVPAPDGIPGAPDDDGTSRLRRSHAGSRIKPPSGPEVELSEGLAP